MAEVDFEEERRQFIVDAERDRLRNASYPIAALEDETRLAQELFPVPSPASTRATRDMATILGQPQQGAVAPQPQPQPTPQSNPGMQSLLNNMQSLLTPTAPTVTRPDNFAQGVRNVFQNTLLRPMEYSLGLRESPTQQYARIRNDTAKVAQFSSLMDILKTQAGYNAAQQVDLSQFGGTDNPLRQALEAAQSSGDISTLIASLEKQRDRLLTDDQKNNYYYVQLKSRNPEAFDMLMEMRAFINPTESVSTAMAYEQMSPEAQEIWKAKNLDSKQQILQNTGNDLGKYFDQVVEHEAKLAGAIAKAQSGGLNLTEGQQALDRAFAPIAASWAFEGGAQTQVSNMSQLNSSINQLMNNPDLTGRQNMFRSGAGLSDQALALQENVARVVTQGMRQIIGAAFTENEAQQFINRTFNPLLPASVNAERLRRLRSQMEQAYMQIAGAVDHFASEGTLSNWGPGATSLTATLEQFEQGMYKAEDYRGLDNNKLLEIVQDPVTNQLEKNVIRDVLKGR
ncbi:MAG: hypothetical protein L7S55_09090 [Luminiphilus sp.]|nr:hypothetical protein [Luminiphilus sp.]